MSVYQVEEYYICTTGEKINTEQRRAIEELLSNEGYSNYGFENDGQITVDGFSSEDDAEEIESAIYKIIKGE
jgi:hypothetical protein